MQRNDETIPESEAISFPSAPGSHPLPKSKMNQRSLVLCVLVATVFATTASEDPCQKQRSICCAPEKFNATMFVSIDTFLHGGRHIRQGYKMDDNADFTNEQISSRGTSLDGSPVYFIMHPNATYDIDEVQGTCVLNPRFPYPGRSCVPDFATSLGQVFYGDVTTDAYRFDVQGRTAFATVTPECFFINEVETKTTPLATIVTTALYSNPRAAVDDSSFVVPSYCPQH